MTHHIGPGAGDGVVRPGLLVTAAIGPRELEHLLALRLLEHRPEPFARNGLAPQRRLGRPRRWHPAVVDSALRVVLDVVHLVAIALRHAILPDSITNDGNRPKLDMIAARRTIAFLLICRPCLSTL